MPVLICIFCLVLIGLKALVTLFKGDASAPAGENAGTEAKPVEHSATGLFAGFWKNEVTYRTVVFVFWLLVFSLSVQYIGFLVTTAVGLTVLFITTSKLSVVKSTIFTAGTLVFVYLLFIYFLDVRFPDGLLF
jgi:hypothetical protein